MPFDIGNSSGHFDSLLTWGDLLLISGEIRLARTLISEPAKIIISCSPSLNTALSAG